jgi:hypothetical protein
METGAAGQYAIIILNVAAKCRGMNTDTHAGNEDVCNK